MRKEVRYFHQKHPRTQMEFTQMNAERSPLLQPETSTRFGFEALTIHGEDRTDTMVEEEEVKIDPIQIRSRKRANDEEEEDEFIPQPKQLQEPESQKKRVNIKVDPFISRDLETELSEVINAFDMIKYGQYMARFVINEIKEFRIHELWIVLGEVMETIPFRVAETILYVEMETLGNGTPEQLKTLCLKIVNRSNWKIRSALQMSAYFKCVAGGDVFHSTEWTQISSDFENIAHKAVYDIESDHLLHLLLTIPFSGTIAPLNILKLALEQKCISFVNNERILNIVNHIWYHGASIDIGQELQPYPLSFTELLPILCFTPIKFYMLPVGYSYTLNVLFGMYLIYVLWYSFEVVNGRATPLTDAILWIFAIGFIFYEISEWVDKGREYFSVSGLMNIWDIMISICWA
eukprot:889298_1